jgi:hypothetical protein
VSTPLDPGRYGSAAAFHTALEARLRTAAHGDPRRLELMRTQFVIARLLTRLELTRPGIWVTKGGSSLLARLGAECRLSRDLDMAHGQLASNGATDLHAAAVLDGADWLRFHLHQSTPLRQNDIVGIRFRLSAAIGQREIVRFGVDVVEGDRIYSGQIERRTAYCPVPLVGAPTTDVLLYPVEDHIADKVAAMGTVHRHGNQTTVSTRYRDIADLALFATTLASDAAALHMALRVPYRHWAMAAFGQSGLRAPGPDWPQRYAATVRMDPDVARRWPTLDDALRAAKPLVDPVLRGHSTGTWDPVAFGWVTA